jgi:hypothetical protein
MSLLEHLPGLAPPDDDIPTTDMAYCACGGIWNVEGLRQLQCPDCGGRPAFVVAGHKGETR